MRSFRTRIPIAVAAVCLISALAVVPGAAAQGSEFDQYVPQVPEAEGDTPVRDKKDRSRSRDRDSGENAATAVPEAVLEDLAAEGVTGEQAAAAAEGTAPDKKKDNDDGRSFARRGDPSAASALAGAATGDSDGGIGVLLPLILVGTLVGALGYVLIVRRGRAG